MVKATDFMAIGDLAARTGVSVSAIRFYEGRGLITALRSPAGQRRFLRSDIRRLSFIRACQHMGFTIEEIAMQLTALPEGRTPTRRDWTRISRSFARIIDERIRAMERMRDRLDQCIGCGCLSLKRCALHNPLDTLSRHGPGPRRLIED